MSGKTDDDIGCSLEPAEKAVREWRIVLKPLLGIDDTGKLVEIERPAVVVVTGMKHENGLVDVLLGGQRIRVFDVDLQHKTTHSSGTRDER